MARGEQFPAAPPQSRGLTAMTGAMALIIILLIVQIYLLSATLEAYLAGDLKAVIPATFFSFAILACCFGLYVFVERIDTDVRKSQQPEPKVEVEPE